MKKVSWLKYDFQKGEFGRQRGGVKRRRGGACVQNTQKYHEKRAEELVHRCKYILLFYYGGGNSSTVRRPRRTRRPNARSLGGRGFSFFFCVRVVGVSCASKVRLTGRRVTIGCATSVACVAFLLARIVVHSFLFSVFRLPLEPVRILVGIGAFVFAKIVFCM